MDDTEYGGGEEDVADTVSVEVEEDREGDTLDGGDPETIQDDADDEQPEPTEGEEETPPEEEEDSELGDAVVTLPDGEEMTVSELMELRASGLRAADYTKKTTEVAREREMLAAEQQRLSERGKFAETALQNLTEYVQGLIPPEPPLSLAQSNPGEYQYQAALRRSAMSEVEKLFHMRDDLSNQQAEVSEADKRAAKERTDAELVKAMPHLRDPGKRAAFDKAVAETAKGFGFTEEDIAATTDPRVLQMVHYARMGRVAEQNRKNAQRRVETPRKGKAPPARESGRDASQRRAMQRLAETGRIEDAMNIDVD